MEQLSNAQEIHFDAFTNVSGASPAIEVSGEFAGTDSINVLLFKNGKVACEVVGDAKGTYLYQPSSNRYDFIAAKKPLPGIARATDLVTRDAGKSSALAFVIALIPLMHLDLITMQQGVKTKAVWTHTESIVAGQTTECDIQSVPGTDEPGTTLTICYTTSPWSIKSLALGIAGFEPDAQGTYSVTYKNCDLVTDGGSYIDLKEFTFTPPASAKRIH
jgi:hypothetical protein